ncbi:MAG: DUF4412 domain-containing protein [Bacteroidota bacterium]|nr:DUF4412 domain-containing protein [Bacteroidota bacterium]
MKIKKVVLIVLLGIFSAFAATAQDLSFNLSVTTPKSTEPMRMKVFVSGMKVAMQPENMGTPGAMTILVDNSAGKQYVLMNANGQKMAMAVNLNDVQKSTDIAKEPKVTLTKETRVIDGYKCTRVITETDDQKTDLWITQDVGMQYADFYKMFNASKGPQGAMMKIPELKNVKGFPVEIVSTDKKKGETLTLKIQNISKAKVDQKLFSLEGYTLMDAGKMTR